MPRSTESGIANPPEFWLAGVTDDKSTPSSGTTANAAKTARISWLTILSVREIVHSDSLGAMRLIDTVNTTITIVSTTAMADASPT